MFYTHRHRHSIATPLSVYRFDSSLPKPCVHPLATSAATVLSGFEPSDHLWHRGLWFTIKFINGSNFWEEHAPFGVQQSLEPACRFEEDGSLTAAHGLRWASGATGLALTEERAITFHEVGTSATQLLTWRSTLTAAQDLTLDRTPFTTWGGYGGLSFRASREMHDVSFTLPSGEAVPQVIGLPHEYIAMAGKMDGGPGRTAAIACFDHPANPRSPVNWYAKSNSGFTFFNAAFLFHEPMTLAKGASLSFVYRLAYRDGAFGGGELAALASDFRKSSF